MYFLIFIITLSKEVVVNNNSQPAKQREPSHKQIKPAKSAFLFSSRLSFLKIADLAARGSNDFGLSDFRFLVGSLDYLVKLFN